MSRIMFVTTDPVLLCDLLPPSRRKSLPAVLGEKEKLSRGSEGATSLPLASFLNKAQVRNDPPFKLSVYFYS